MTNNVHSLADEKEQIMVELVEAAEAFQTGMDHYSREQSMICGAMRENCSCTYKALATRRQARLWSFPERVTCSILMFRVDPVIKRQDVELDPIFGPDNFPYPQ